MASGADMATHGPCSTQASILGAMCGCKPLAVNCYADDTHIYIYGSET